MPTRLLLRIRACHRTQEVILRAHVAATPAIDANPLALVLSCEGLDTTIVLTNPTNDTETITSIAIGDARITFPGMHMPLTLPPGAMDTLRLNFSIMDTSSIADSLMIVGQPCNFVKTIAITVTILPIQETLVLFVDSGAPGDTVKLPVLFQSRNNIQIAGLSCLVQMSYNPSILLPINVIGGTLDSLGNGYVVFTIENVSDTGYLECIVGLGDSTATLLHIDSINWGCAAQSSGQDGKFTLTGLCMQGGTRLFIEDSGMTLAQNVPNPVNGETTIRFRTIENGQTQLWIADVLGRRQAILMMRIVRPGHIRHNSMHNTYNRVCIITSSKHLQCN